MAAMKKKPPPKSQPKQQKGKKKPMAKPFKPAAPGRSY